MVLEMVAGMAPGTVPRSVISACMHMIGLVANIIRQTWQNAPGDKTGEAVMEAYWVWWMFAVVL